MFFLELQRKDAIICKTLRLFIKCNIWYTELSHVSSTRHERAKVQYITISRMFMQPSFLLVDQTIPVGSLLSFLTATNYCLCRALN